MTTMIDTAERGRRVRRRHSRAVPGARAHAQRLPVAYSRRPRRHAGAARRGAAMEDYLFHHNANTHWRYPTSEETDALIADAREALADFLNGRADEIAFGQNMTSLTFHLARALRPRWGKGDEVVITELDHHGNVAPWTRARKRTRHRRSHGARCAPRTAASIGATSRHAITPRTKLLAIGAASNALGTITDVARAATLAHAVGAKSSSTRCTTRRTCSSTSRPSAATSSAARRTSSTVRTSASCGASATLIESLDVPRLAPAPQESPERLETGTQNHEGIVGAAAAVDFLASLATATAARVASACARRSARFMRAARCCSRKLWNSLAADRRADALRTEARNAAHADVVVHAARFHDGRRRDRAREARRVRVERRFLRGDGHRALGVVPEDSFASGVAATRASTKSID